MMLEQNLLPLLFPESTGLYLHFAWAVVDEVVALLGQLLQNVARPAGPPVDLLEFSTAVLVVSAVFFRRVRTLVSSRLVQVSSRSHTRRSMPSFTWTPDS